MKGTSRCSVLALESDGGLEKKVIALTEGQIILSLPHGPARGWGWGTCSVEP